MLKEILSNGMLMFMLGVITGLFYANYLLSKGE